MKMKYDHDAIYKALDETADVLIKTGRSALAMKMIKEEIQLMDKYITRNELEKLIADEEAVLDKLKKKMDVLKEELSECIS